MSSQPPVVKSLSSKQVCKHVRDCPEKELDSALQQLKGSYPGCKNKAFVALIMKYEFGVRALFERFTSIGFDMNAGSIEVIYIKYTHWGLLPPAKVLQLSDFDLILSLWAALSSSAQEWFGLLFLSYWESSARPALSGQTLMRFKPMWESLTPTMKQKLSPSRVCGLGWSPVDTTKLIHTHVDTTGDMLEFAQEMMQRGIITPKLVSQHPGFIAALTSFDPHWLVTQLLSGEVTLEESPKPSLALQLTRTIFTVLESPAWPEVTAQHAKHLGKILALLKDVKGATNMMYQGLDQVLGLVDKIRVVDHHIIRKVADFYRFGDRSSIAQIPNPARSETHYGDATQKVHVFEAFVQKAIQFVSMQELVTLQCITDCPWSDVVRSNFHLWTMTELDKEQGSDPAECVLQSWAVRICSPTQVLDIWLKMVTTFQSWSFLINSWDALAHEFHPEAAKADEAKSQLVCGMYDRMVEQLEKLPQMADQRRLQIMVRLAKFWPQRFVEQHGATTWIELDKVPSSRLLVGCVHRKANCVNQEAALRDAQMSQQINDMLFPVKEFQALLGKHPTIEKTKTKEEWAMVWDWVENVDVYLFCDAEITEKMSQVMCAVWGDKAALLLACGNFCLKLLECLAVTQDCSALLKFVRKCPNIGNKKQFLVTQFERVKTLTKKPTLQDLHPILEAQIQKVGDLVDLIHTLGCAKITGQTESLFFQLLGKEEEPFARVQLLKGCRFSAGSHCCPEGDCVEAEEDFWLQLEKEALAGGTDGMSNVTPDIAEVPMGSAVSIFKKFGAQGEAVLVEFLSAAEPAQLRELFSDSKPFREMCQSVMGSWHLGDCPAGQEDALVDVIYWFPEMYDTLAPKVLAKEVNELSEKRVRSMLAKRAPDLDVLPNVWWHCICFGNVKEADLVRLTKSGVVIHPKDVNFGELEWDTQKLLLELHSNDIEVLVGFAPAVVAGIVDYLEHIFKLLSNSDDFLINMGDGLDKPEQLESGWNKMVNSLLCAIRERIKGGNVLHTSEQLVLFAKCEGRVDNTNSALLADFMESKYTDPLHVNSLVNYVLSSGKFNKQVRDSALRAMARLDTEDRDVLHKRLLNTTKQLPMQVLLSLTVSVLNKQVIPLVNKQLDLLSATGWEELLDLIRDANPKQGRVHTFPRSLRSTFNERFLVRYLEDKTRDVRLFHLFTACTDSDKIAAYLLDVLARELHPLDDTFLSALSFRASAEDVQFGLEVQNAPLNAEHFRNLIEYIQPNEWNVRMPWVLHRIQDSSEPDTLLRFVVDLLGQKKLQGTLSIGVLKLIMQWGGDEGKPGILLKQEKLRAILHQAVPKHATEKDRSLWIAFFQHSWIVGVPEPAKRVAEVTAAFDLKEKPFVRSEVASLGVDLPSWKLLVQLAPEHAIQQHGFSILKQEPTFAKTLTDAEFAQITQLDPKTDTLWPLIRSVVVEVEPDRALPLAIALVIRSKEERDIELLKTAYHKADRFTRKQICLKTQLRSVWHLFGEKIQQDVIDEISCGIAMSPAISAYVPPEHRKGKAN